MLDVARIVLALGALPAWSGTFELEDVAGPSVVEFRADLTKASSQHLAVITAVGFQTDETILATAREDGADLVLRFKSYANGRLENAYGVAVYKPGDELVRLQRSRAEEARWIWGKLLHNSTGRSGTARLVR